MPIKHVKSSFPLNYITQGHGPNLRTDTQEWGGRDGSGPEWPSEVRNPAAFLLRNFTHKKHLP